MRVAEMKVNWHQIVEDIEGNECVFEGGQYRGGWKSRVFFLGVGGKMVT